MAIDSGREERAVALTHAHISQALLASTDDGRTIDFSHTSLGEIPESVAEELTRVGVDETDGSSTITRLALGYNHLTTLPQAFAHLRRLRYLNLRVNSLSMFPDVLTTMPSLEILDISRNKITSLPSRPGSLLNLRVFSLSKNRLERLPSYIADFHKLKVLKVENNPIEWPPKSVLEIPETTDADSDMETWVRNLRLWVSDNAEDESGDSTRNLNGLTPDTLTWRPNSRSQSESDRDTTSSDDDVIFHRSAQGDWSHSTLRGTHSRMQSTDSVSSTDSDNLSMLEDPSFQFIQSSPSSYSTNITLPPQAEEQLSPVPSSSHQHSRNASYSVGGVGSRSNPVLASKKSLPDLRAFGGKKSTRTRVPQPEPSPEFRPSGAQAKPTLTEKKSYPGQNESSFGGLSLDGVTPSIDVERNSYFRRLSTLPLSTISKAIPHSLLRVIDAIRGILFAISQLYSALRNYTVSASDERIATTFSRVLEPANRSMGNLIDALDRFDSLSRRGLPPPAVCKDLLQCCKENVSIFGKMATMLQSHLKMLTKCHDTRYTRTLLLMLYGSMGEISNSWIAMAPHLEAIQPLLRDAPILPLKTPLPIPSSSRSFISPIIEAQESLSPPTMIRSNSAQPYDIARSRQRRHAGSFSYKDVEIGKTLPSHPALPPRNDSLPAVVGSPSAPLRSVLRNPPSSNARPPSPLPPPVPSSPALSSLPPHSRTHSRENFHLNNGSMATIKSPTISSRTQSPSVFQGMTSSGRSHAHELLPDSGRIIDTDLLFAIEAAVTAAETVWSMLDGVLPEQGQTTEVKDAAERADAVTKRLKSLLVSARDGNSPVDRRALDDDVHLFAKSVVHLTTILKDVSSAHPLSASLRERVAKLIQTTREMTMSALSRDESRPSSSLSRSKSAVASQNTAKPTQLMREPWSALPHQTFKLP